MHQTLNATAVDEQQTPNGIFTHYRNAIDIGSPNDHTYTFNFATAPQPAYNPIATEDIELVNMGNSNPISTQASIFTPYQAFEETSRAYKNKSKRTLYNYNAGFYYICWQCGDEKKETIQNVTSLTYNNTNEYLIYPIATGAEQPHIKGILDALIMHQSYIELPRELDRLRQSREKVSDLPFPESENIRIRLMWCIYSAKQVLKDGDNSPAHIFHAAHAILATHKEQEKQRSGHVDFFDKSIRTLVSLVERNTELLKTCLQLHQEFQFEYSGKIAFASAGDREEYCNIFAPFAQQFEGLISITVNPGVFITELNANPCVDNMRVGRQAENSTLHYQESFREKFIRSYGKFVDNQTLPSIATYFAFVYWMVIDNRMITTFMFGFFILYGGSFDLNLFFKSPENPNQPSLMDDIKDQASRLYNKLTGHIQIGLDDALFPGILLTMASLTLCGLFGLSTTLQALGLATALFSLHNFSMICSPDNASRSIILNGMMMLLNTAGSLLIGHWTTLTLTLVGLFTFFIKESAKNEFEEPINIFSVAHMNKYGILPSDMLPKQAFLTNKELWGEDCFATRKLSIETLLSSRR